MHEYRYLVELKENFVVKTKQIKFCTTHSNICISLALWRFSDDFHSKKLRALTATQMLSTERRKIHGSVSHI